MNRIDKKKAFIAFITAGYPDLNTTARLVKELEIRGVDIVELGVPFSDPLADGPVIQKASEESLRTGTNLSKILNLVRNLRHSVRIPICLMTYYNPVFRFGEERFIRQAEFSGVDGLIIPDLPPEEAKKLLYLCHRHDICLIPFIAPTTTLERIRFINKIARGFIYYVSLTGVTGARKELPRDLVKNLKKVRKFTDKPVCVGFGISRKAQLKQVYKVADGAIVGSAIVKIIGENLGRKDLVGRVGNYVSSMLKNVS